jgi:hypothetical protein
MGIRGMVLRGAAVLSVAIAAGHLVHLVRPEAALTVLRSKPPQETATVSADLSVPKSASLSSGLTTPEIDLIGITAVAADLTTTDNCATTLRLSPAPGAMIDLALTAPCNQAERIVIRHAGLSFTARTDQSGTARLQLPALQPDAVVAVYLAGSSITLARLEVPEAAQTRRFAFQWASTEAFTLRATEGDQLYVAAPDSRFSQTKVLSLGNSSVQDPMLAQVYTFPAGSDAATNLAVELRVSPTTCGRTLAAQTLTSAWGHVQLTEFPVAVPLCGTSGDILVLKNLAPDLTLATPN